MSSDLDGKSLGRQVNSFPAKQGRALRLVRSKLWGVWKFEYIPDCQYIGRVVAAISIQWWEPRMLSIQRKAQACPSCQECPCGDMLHLSPQEFREHTV